MPLREINRICDCEKCVAKLSFAELQFLLQQETVAIERHEHMHDDKMSLL